MLNAQDTDKAREWLQKIEQLAAELDHPVNIMEVCGTHTVAIAQNGLRELLPASLRLLSGPGCPVCVTDEADIDALIRLAQQPGITLATFGDLMRVPGEEGSLQEAKAGGANIKVVYSTLDAVALAQAQPEQQVVFAGIGFETTAPTVAVSIEMAARQGLRNYSVWSLHKTVPPALRVLLEDPEVQIDAFINPGHVCTILGTEPFQFIAGEFQKPCVVTGFEANDILEAIWMILEQHRLRQWAVAIQYRRAVQAAGNPVAISYLQNFFVVQDANWRGLGIIPGSGLEIAPAYADWNARMRFVSPLSTRRRPSESRPPCLCGAILKGLKTPLECPSFGRNCTPLRPVGPCMVSQEGACAAYYRYQPAQLETR